MERCIDADGGQMHGSRGHEALLWFSLRLIVCVALTAMFMTSITHSVRAAENPSPNEQERSSEDLAFKPGSEPEGFGGLKWGTELEALPGMTYSKVAEIGGSLPDDLWDLDNGKMKEGVTLKVYVRDNDELKIWEIKVDRIEYGFWNEKLCEVTVTVKGSANWPRLEKAIVGRYGETRKNTFPSRSPSGETEEFLWYRWAGRTTEMELGYTSADQTGQLWIGSTLLRSQIFDTVRKKMEQR